MATLKFIQAQPFSLAGSGASIGDTTIILQSMVGIDGTNITTTDLGDICYGTLEPGNGTQEEAFQFTGITQNSNGTATLTGVSTLLFKYPYTVTSGLAKTHAGASKVVLSNDAAFYNNILSYINSTASSGAPLASEVTTGITKLSVAAASPSTPIAVGDNDNRMLASGTTMYVNSIKNTGIPYAVATGTANAYTVTLASAISTLASGTMLNFVVPSTNATAVTLNVNSLGAKSITKKVSTTLASADLLIGQIAEVVYDGTRFQLVSPVPSGTLFKSGVTTHDLSSTTTQNIAHGLGVIPSYIRIYMTYANTTLTTTSIGNYDGTTMNYVFLSTDMGSGTTGLAASAQNYIAYAQSNDAGQNAHASVTFDATNIILTWTKDSTPTGNAFMMWEAFIS